MSSEFAPEHATAMGRDSRFRVTVAEDNLSAMADFLPALGDGELLGREYIETILSTNGILSGIDWQVIDEAIEECNKHSQARLGVIIARGRPPVRLNPQHLVLEAKFAPRDNPAVPVEKGGRVNHRAARHLPIVMAGETIAREEPEMPGIDGVAIDGSPIPHGRREIMLLKPGENTARQDDRVVATKSGMVVLKAEEFRVEENLQIKGDVDYHTGSITFPGNLYLSGAVHDGFRLWIGGSIVSTGVVDAYEVFCRKDFIAKDGIIGRQRALVRVAGRVQAKYVENCTVESKSSVYIQATVFNSRIFTLDRLVMAEKGRLIGGQVRCAHGVVTDEIGNEAGVVTEVITGIDFIVERKLAAAKEKFQELTLELQKLDKILTRSLSEELQKRRAMLSDAVYKYSVLMSTLVSKLDRNEDAPVVARKAVYPGTVVEICRSSFRVEEPRGPTRFRLDRDSGRVIAEDHSDAEKDHLETVEPAGD